MTFRSVHDTNHQNNPHSRPWLATEQRFEEVTEKYEDLWYEQSEEKEGDSRVSDLLIPQLQILQCRFTCRAGFFIHRRILSKLQQCLQNNLKT